MEEMKSSMEAQAPMTPMTLMTPVPVKKHLPASVWIVLVGASALVVVWAYFYTSYLSFVPALVSSTHNEQQKADETAATEIEQELNATAIEGIDAELGSIETEIR